MWSACMLCVVCDAGVYYARDLVRAGFRTLRVELLDEQPQHVGQLMEGYR